MPMTSQRAAPRDQKMVDTDHRTVDAATSTDEKSMDLKSLLQSFHDDKEEDSRKLIVKLNQHDDIFDALKQMDPNLISTLAGDSCCCCFRHNVETGQIGCATRFGKTFFFRPGAYMWTGIGVRFMKIKNIQETEGNQGDGNQGDGNQGDGNQGDGHQFKWMDISYLNISETNVAVVQKGRKQLVLDSGRYLMRDPAVSYGLVNIQNLTEKKHVIAITEQERNGVDVDIKVKIKAGSYQHAGAVTFVRAEPGFCYVVQDLKGMLRTGVGMTICRGGEVFLEFIDRQNYARTTRAFTFESSDRQQVQVRVQLRWKVEKAKLWIQRRGAFDDIFDAIEEITESLLRDTIAGQTNDDCRQQAANGFETIEKAVMDPLKDETGHLGGVLLGFEIRTLRFPFLDRRNKERADKEDILNQQLQDAKRQLGIDIENRKRQEANLLYTQSEDMREVTHSIKMQKLKDKEKLDKLSARAELEKAEQNFDLQKRQLMLEAEKKQQIMELQQEELKVTAEVKRQLIEQTGIADEAIQDAKAEAEAVKATAGAKAYAKLTLATSEAKAAERIGAAYKGNEHFMELQIAKMHEKVLNKRAIALARAQMLPEDLQQELSRFSAAEEVDVKQN